MGNGGNQIDPPLTCYPCADMLLTDAFLRIPRPRQPEKQSGFRGLFHSGDAERGASGGGLKYRFWGKEKLLSMEYTPEGRGLKAARDRRGRRLRPAGEGIGPRR